MSARCKTPDQFAQELKAKGVSIETIRLFLKSDNMQKFRDVAESELLVGDDADIIDLKSLIQEDEVDKYEAARENRKNSLLKVLNKSTPKIRNTRSVTNAIDKEAELAIPYNVNIIITDVDNNGVVKYKYANSTNEKTYSMDAVDEMIKLDQASIEDKIEEYGFNVKVKNPTEVLSKEQLAIIRKNRNGC